MKLAQFLQLKPAVNYSLIQEQGADAAQQPSGGAGPGAAPCAPPPSGNAAAGAALGGMPAACGAVGARLGR
jgi:hypothetical protein